MELAQLVAALVLLAANFFFVAVEFSITRARPSEVAELEEQGVRGAKSLRHAVDHIDAYLSACQLGITIASIGLGIFGERSVGRLLGPILTPLGEWAGIGAFSLTFASAYALVSMFHVVLGELTPKSLAISRTRPTGLLLAPPMRLFYLATRPVVDLLNWMGNIVLRPFGIPPAREAGHTPHSEPELRWLLLQSQQAGVLDVDEQKYAENVLLFGDLRAREVMVPRPEVRFATTDQTVSEVARVVTESGSTRLPVCEPGAGLDAAVGLVHAKDLLAPLQEGRGDCKVGELARPLHRFADSMLVDEVLRALRPTGQHMALVVDEHGTALGVVTLEDILEEIVGEIEDEFDRDETPLVVVEAEGVRVRGSAPVSLVEEELGLELNETRETTIGGYVVERLGRMPDLGERIDFDGREAEVCAVEEARVLELHFGEASEGAAGGRRR